MNDEDEEIRRSSWLEVVRNLNKEKREWVVYPTLAWQSEVIKMNKEKKKEEEEEEEEEEEKEKKEKEKEKKKKLKRPWNSLPSTALLNIFCKSELKDRIQSIPLVCKSWKYVSDDPRCWTSMIPDSVSPEDAFIKNTSGYQFQTNKLSEILVSKYYQHYNRVSIKEIEFEEEIPVPVPPPIGLSRLRTLIKKSGGGAVITTLYLSPFTPCRLWHCSIEQCDEILHLIANCCPNLKHISLEAPWLSNTETLLQLFNRCKKLELVDLCYTRDANVVDAPLLLQELGKCLPNLRGIRIKGLAKLYYYQEIPIAVSIATYLPLLKLLSFDSTEFSSYELSTILFSCLELQYLYVKDLKIYYNQDIIDQASAQIPQFYYERNYEWHDDDYDQPESDHLCYYCSLDEWEWRGWREGRGLQEWQEWQEWRERRGWREGREWREWQEWREWRERRKPTEHNHCIDDQYSTDSHIDDDFSVDDDFRIADYDDDFSVDDDFRIADYCDNRKQIADYCDNRKQREEKMKKKKKSV